MTDVVMLVCNINEELVELSMQAIHSFKEGAGMGKLIIIDNASTHGVGRIREEADIYIRNSTNLGYPAAVNQGMSLARTDLVAIANNDIRVSPNWETIARSVLEYDKAVSVHFRMIPYNDPFLPGNDVWFTGKERWCHASFYVIKRSIVKEGMYFEGYKEGGMDDWDLQHRLRHVEGWLTPYTNRACFQHQDSSTYMALDARDGNRSVRDKDNAELFRQRWGDYADNIWNKKYPEQMSIPWKPFP